MDFLCSAIHSSFISNSPDWKQPGDPKRIRDKQLMLSSHHQKLLCNKRECANDTQHDMDKPQNVILNERRHYTQEHVLCDPIYKQL